MILRQPLPEEPIDQGDIIDGCPVLNVAGFDPSDPMKLDVTQTPCRVVVLTQTCDLANRKAQRAVVALVLDAQELVAQHALSVSQIRGPVRAGQVFGWYFLPKNQDLGLPESLVDLRRLYTIPVDLLTALCRRGQRRARVQPLYREHLAQHFATTYARIGLPEPYPTE